MLNQQLLDYIKQQIQEGVDRVQIKNSLLANGWPELVIEEAFNSLSPISDISSQTQNLESSEKIISSLPGPVETLSQTLTLFKQRIGTFLGILLIGLLLGSTVLIASNFNAILVIPLFIVYWIIQIWGQTALLYAINGSQENIGILESYKRGWRKIFSIWWINFLVLFITTCGAFLFIIPGIIFAVWFTLAMFVLVAEDERGMNALLKSREYVRGRELSVFWHLLLLSLISSVISLVISFISAIIPSRYSIFSEISSIVILLILAPLVMTYLFHLYKNLKALRGEFTFIPTRKMKIMFVLVTIIGIIIPIILFSSIFFTFLSKPAEIIVPDNEKVIDNKSNVSAMTTSRDAQRKTGIRNIRSMMEMFYEEHGRYPSSLEELKPEHPIDLIVDPSTKQPYRYEVQPNGMNYKICANLESTQTEECITP